MVHKLDVLTSWCLADSLKYVRESVKKSQWRWVNVLPHVGWSFLLLGNEERECALSCLLACPTAGQWGREKKVRNGEHGFLGCPGRWPRQVTWAEGHQSFSLDEIYKFKLQQPKQFLHKIIILNSFCYTIYPPEEGLAEKSELPECCWDSHFFNNIRFLSSSTIFGMEWAFLERVAP